MYIHYRKSWNDHVSLAATLIECDKDGDKSSKRNTDERGTLKYNGRSLQRLSVIECLLSMPHFADSIQ